jgi:hypothetical protein
MVKQILYERVDGVAGFGDGIFGGRIQVVWVVGGDDVAGVESAGNIDYSRGGNSVRGKSFEVLRRRELIWARVYIVDFLERVTNCLKFRFKNLVGMYFSCAVTIFMK